MITISAHEDGSILSVRAQPNAKKNAVQGEQAGSLKVVVTAPPEDGRANQALVEVLREWLGVKRSQLELVSGITSREKKVLVRGMTPDELRERITRLLSGE